MVHRHNARQNEIHSMQPLAVSRTRVLAYQIATFTVVVLACLDSAISGEISEQISEEVCFEISSDLASGNVKRATVRPVTEFPAEHPIVQNTICGQSFKPGDPIPAQAW